MIKNKRLCWPDSLAYVPDVYRYVCDLAIPHQMLQSKADTKANAPCAIYRFKPGAEGIAEQ